MHGRLRVALAILVSLVACPTIALAEDGFIGGLQDFAGVREVDEVQPEKEFNESYEPQEVLLSLPSAEPLPEDATTVDQVNAMSDVFNRVPWGQNQYPIINWVRSYFTNDTMKGLLLSAAVGIVFMWWGVRKALRMIMSAWRKGRQSV